MDRDEPDGARFRVGLEGTIEQSEGEALCEGGVWDYILLEDVSKAKKEELKDDWKEILTAFLKGLGALIINVVSLRFRSFVSKSGRE